MNKPMTHEDVIVLRATVIGLAALIALASICMASGMKGTQLRWFAPAALGVFLPLAFRADWAAGVVFLLLSIGVVALLFAMAKEAETTTADKKTV